MNKAATIQATAEANYHEAALTLQACDYFLERAQNTPRLARAKAHHATALAAFQLATNAYDAAMDL